jgi:hypothetical protein
MTLVIDSMQNGIGLFDTPHEGYSVRRIDPKETYHYLLNIHYAKRIPSISYAYGLYLDDDLVGVITYGSPASPSLCTGICGPEYRSKVLELNRLCLKNNQPNEASRLVGASFKLLPKPTIIVSYADTQQKHEGIVYQATNFLYTGLSAQRNEWTVKGLEHMHSKTLSDGNTLESIKEKYGDDFYYRERSRKHRYIMMLGSKSEKKQMIKDLRYEVQEYPSCS